MSVSVAVDGGASTLELPPVELRLSGESAVADYVPWGEGVGVLQVMASESCPDAALECAELVPAALDLTPAEPLVVEAQPVIEGEEASGELRDSQSWNPTLPDVEGLAGEARDDAPESQDPALPESIDGEATAAESATFLLTPSAGGYAATPSIASGSWQVGPGSGEFSYGYDFQLPDPLQTGAIPSLGLTYSSGSVDAMTTNENGQGSAAGLGWEMERSYIARSYAACADDGDLASGELCWKSIDGQPWENLTLVHGGRSSALIPVARGGDRFRLRDDPGWRITRVVDQGVQTQNADNDQEAFKVETPDGATYWFGYSIDMSEPPGSNGVRPSTNSVWTVPVRGNDQGEPCHQARCRQAWQWNLDRVEDRHGNLSTLTYSVENNYYNGPGGDNTADVEYVSAGALRRIRYGSRAAAPEAFTAEVDVSSRWRCVPPPDGSCQAPSRVAEVADTYPDTPLAASFCGEGTACDNVSPSFFSTRRYDEITTRVLRDEVWRGVDRYALTPKYLGNGADGLAHVHLWLDSITHEGIGDDSPTLEVTFDHVMLRGSVEGQAGVPDFYKPRVSGVLNASGGYTSIDYDTSDGVGDDPSETPQDAAMSVCNAGYIAGRESWESTRNCFAQYNARSDRFEWFHKYLVRRVGKSDRALGYAVPPRLGLSLQSPGDTSILGEWEVTDYEYAGAPAWRYTPDPNANEDHESWRDWRGYEKVLVKRRESVKRELTGVSSTTVVTRFRGMNRTLKSPNPPVRHTDVRVATTEAEEEDPLDEPRYAGRVAETLVRGGGADADPLQRTYTSYTTIRTVDPLGGEAQRYETSANYVYGSTQVEHTYVKNGDDVRLVTQNTVHSGGTEGRGVLLGALLSSTARGNDGLTVQTCADTTWKSNDDPDTFIRVPVTTRSFRGECDPQASTLESSKTIYYDDSTPGNPAPLTRGNPTLVETELDATSTAREVFQFDAWGRATLHRNANDVAKGRTGTRYAYNPQTSPSDYLATSRVTNTLGQESSVQYDYRRGQPTTVTDPNGNRTRYTYDALGRLTEVFLPSYTTAGSTTSTPSIRYKYREFSASRAANNMSERIETLTRRDSSTVDSTFTYHDGWGRPVETQSLSVSHEYPSGVQKSGRVVDVTGYDSSGRIAYQGVQLPSNELPGAGLLNPVLDLSSSASAKRFTHTEYDALNRPSRVASTFQAGMEAEVVMATTDYVHSGDSTITKPPVGGWTKDTVNARGELARTEQLPGGDATVDPLLEASYTYDAAGRIRSIESPISSTTPGAWTYRYDLGGRRTRASDPDTGVSTTSYDALGNIVDSTDGAGRILTHTYDDLDRLKLVSSGGRTLISRTYDQGANGLGRLSAATRFNYSPDSTTPVEIKRTYAYDSRGQNSYTSWQYPKSLLAENSTGTQNSHITTTVNEAGWPIARGTTVTANPGGSAYVEYAYNGAGQMSAITNGGWSIAHDFKYWSDNRPWAFRSGNSASGQHAIQHWLSENQADGSWNGLHSQANGSSQDTTRQLKYTRDKVGNVVQVLGTELSNGESTDRTATWCYTYDGLNRLKTARTGTATAQGTCGTSTSGDLGILQKPYSYTYGYDHNRLASVSGTFGGSVNGTVSYAYTDPAHPHAPTTAPGTSTPNGGVATMTYNADGGVATRTANGATDTFTYDPFGKYARVTKNSPAQTEDYYYDADGLRVGLVTSTGSSRRAILTMGDMTLDSNAPTQGEFQVTLPDGTPVATHRNGAWEWLYVDAQRSTRFRQTSTGLTKLEYTPYGSLITTGNSGGGQRGYLNKIHDTSGEIQLDHRKYPALNQTFLNPDPLLIPSNPQTLNPNAYAQYNPTTLNDPTGLRPTDPNDDLNVDVPNLGYGLDGYHPGPPEPDPHPEIPDDWVPTRPSSFYTNNISSPRSATGGLNPNAAANAETMLKIAFLDWDCEGSACFLEGAMVLPWFKIGKLSKLRFLGDLGHAAKSVGKEVDTFYPASNGFLGAADEVYLQPGQMIDRYGGSGYSRFFSPQGTAAEMRALPPGVGDQPLRTFEVMKPFPVQSGTVAPAFGQLGLGTQHLAPVRLEVLLKRGILREVG